jgi:hypothetical protein
MTQQYFFSHDVVITLSENVTSQLLTLILLNATPVAAGLRKGMNATGIFGN